MDIGNIVYWDAYRSVGSKFGRVNNGGVDSDVGAKVGIVDVEWFEQEAVGEFGSRDGKSVDKFVKGVISGVSVGVGYSIGWSVDRGVVAGIYSADGIKLGIDD